MKMYAKTVPDLDAPKKNFDRTKFVVPILSVLNR